MGENTWPKLRQSVIYPLVALTMIVGHGAAGDREPPPRLIGYTQYRANLPGGRFDNVATMRAMVVDADGSNAREIAAELRSQPGHWTQFAGWSPDGRQAIVYDSWEDPQNARWEEEHKTFRFGAGWLIDSVLVDTATGAIKNLTAVERVSRYNTGLFYWPDKPDKLGFTALIDDISHPFEMNLDGTGKRDLTSGTNGFTYGFNASPDGQRIAYHKDYQVYLANADGSDARRIETGNSFNFAPQWSPDGKHVLFLSGEHYNCHPHVVARDGSGLRKLADRGGYRGVVEFLDVPDFHGGSSDVPSWTGDGQGVYFTRQTDGAVELCVAPLVGEVKQLTHSSPGTSHYHPKASQGGEWLVYGSRRSDGRQLYIARADGSEARAITRVEPGWGAMWAWWQPSGE